MKARVYSIHRVLEESPLEATQRQKLVCKTISANLVRGERSAGRERAPARPSVAYLSSVRRPGELTCSVPREVIGYKVGGCRRAGMSVASAPPPPPRLASTMEQDAKK